MSEEWKQCPSYPLYEVSDKGHVRSIRSGKVLKYGVNQQGYYLASMSVGGHKQTKTVHSLVAEAFIGPRPEGYLIHHINKWKIDNRPENLEYLTYKEHYHKHT